MNELLFEPSQIVIIEEELSKEDVLIRLANVLYKKGIVKQSYLSAILERENNYPTGLEVQGINVAIPHCDIVNVNHGGLCVGIIKKGTKFAKMDDPDTEVSVQMVVMLALNEAHGHVEMLQKIIALIQNQELLSEIVSTNEIQKIYDLTKDKLL